MLLSLYHPYSMLFIHIRLKLSLIFCQVSPLVSQINILKGENTALINKIEEIENGQWKNFYYGFTFCDIENINTTIQYWYQVSLKAFYMEMMADDYGTLKVLIILIDQKNVKHFIQTNSIKQETYTDEIYGK